MSKDFWLLYRFPSQVSYQSTISTTNPSFCHNFAHNEFMCKKTNNIDKLAINLLKKRKMGIQVNRLFQVFQQDDIFLFIFLVMCVSSQSCCPGCYCDVTTNWRTDPILKAVVIKGYKETVQYLRQNNATLVGKSRLALKNVANLQQQVCLILSLIIFQLSSVFLHQKLKQIYILMREEGNTREH